MKFILFSMVVIVLFAACKKQDNGPDNTGILNIDTLSIQTNISENLQAIHFLDGKTGFVAGLKGGIYKTTDSAKSWTVLNSTTSLPVYSLFFTDSLQGFAVGGQVGCSGAGCTSPGGFILKTINGGQSWTTVYMPSEKTEILSIYFVSNTIGFCIGRNIIMKTTDAGQT